MGYTLAEIIKDAREIEAFCNSPYASDRELETRAEKFIAKYRVSWTFILDQFKDVKID